MIKREEEIQLTVLRIQTISEEPLMTLWFSHVSTMRFPEGPT